MRRLRRCRQQKNAQRRICLHNTASFIYLFFYPSPKRRWERVGEGYYCDVQREKRTPVLQVSVGFFLDGVVQVN